MAVNHLVRQAQCDAELAHFVLEQFAQRFQQLQVQRLRQAADVVVALDRMGLAGLGSGRLDHVRVDGALRQPASVRQLLGLGLEDLDKLATDDLALGFRIGNAPQVAHELRGGIDVDDLDAKVTGKGLHHLLAFVQAQEAVVDEDAGQLVADGTVQQRSNHRGIDAAGKAEDHLFLADLRTHLLDRLIDVVRHVPVVAAAANLVHEAGKHLLALDRVRDFRVKLHGVKATGFVGHCRDRAGLAAGDDLEAGRQFGDLVAMAHPYVEQAVAFVVRAVLDALEQLGMATGANLGVAELALARALDLAAQLLGHGLHAVTDAEHRHAELEHDLRGLPVLRLIDRVRPAGKDDAFRVEVADELLGDVERMQFAIDLMLAHAAGNQLGNLGAEIEDEDLLVSHFRALNEQGRP